MWANDPKKKSTKAVIPIPRHTSDSNLFWSKSSEYINATFDETILKVLFVDGDIMYWRSKLNVAFASNPYNEIKKSTYTTIDPLITYIFEILEFGGSCNEK